MTTQELITETALEKGPSLQLKGSLLTLTLLELRHYDFDQFNHELAQLVKQAPNFFSQTPVVLSLEKLINAEESIDFIEIVQICQEYGLHPVAIKGGGEQQQTSAILAGLPRIPASTKKNTTHWNEPSTELSADLSSEVIEQTQTHTKIIRHAVRSGQQIYAQNSDLIILGPVSAGAEILADGNIHVYGPLRGRALAGVKGDEQTFIFCQRLEAELLSIAGNYKVNEDLRKHHWGEAINASLNGNQLKISKL